MAIMTRRAAFKIGTAGLLSPITRTLQALALSCAPPIDDEIQENERDKMANIGRSFMDRFDVPGLSVAIAHNGRLVYQVPFGYADRDAGERLLQRHLFRIASVTKPLTSVAIFTLIQSGTIDLATHVFGSGGILGKNYGTYPYRQYVEDITIDHLLTHTSGGWEKGSFDPMFCKSRLSQQELISWTIDNRPLDYTPGTHWAYSNFGYCILGRVIEEATKQNYCDYIQNKILTPSGIADMRIGGSKRTERLPNEVLYYGQNGEDPYGFDVKRMDSNGGWIATPRDLVCFLINIGGFDSAQQILVPDTIKIMITPCAANKGYAKGWGINGGNWTHTGSLQGTSAVIARTSKGVCWAAIANTRRPPEDLMNRALGNMLWDMARQVRAWNV